MSTRMEWAQERLTEYLRSRETDEIMTQLADVSHLHDRVCDLENGQSVLDDEINFLRVRVETVEEGLDDLAS